MLKRLFIKNYALIEYLDLDFQDEFITITGQTGSGKSIMLGALSMVLGSRVDTSVVLDKSEKCIVEAHFSIHEIKTKKLFERLDVDFDEHSIFRREINVNGKSRAFVNDMPVPLSVMKELGGELIDVHSQHQTLKLNEPDYQLHILDTYAGNAKTLKSYQKVFREWKRLKIELAQLEESRDIALKEFDFVQFQLKELNETGLENEDWEKIQADFQLINSSKEILEALTRTEQLFEGEWGALENIKTAVQEYESLKHKHKNFDSIAQRLNSLRIELEDIASENEQLKSSVEFDSTDEERIHEKLDELNHLLFKHRVSDIDELMRIKSELESKVNASGELDNKIAESQKRLEECESILENLSGQLRNVRVKASNQLTKKCEQILNGLQMKNVKLTYTLDDLSEYSSNGKDRANLNFSPDKGLTNLPIQKVASGGEVSRVMLAIKSLLAHKATLPTIIFDEIDTGVSGEVASNTATLLRNMSEKMQVIAITHLPQVAALGDSQYLVSKEESGDRPNTKIEQLDEEARVKEIGKMLSGSSITTEALANAKVLLGN